MQKIFAAITLALLSLPVWAAPQTVTLDLPTMNCALCPITVKKALSKVEGVTEVNVSFENKQAVVTFEDAKTSTDELVKATTNAGYYSTVKN